MTPGRSRAVQPVKILWIQQESDEAVVGESGEQVPSRQFARCLLSSEINVLEKVCNKASKIIIRDFGEIEKLQVSKKGPGDFVTKTDKKVEQIIIEELEKASPGFNILA